MADPKPRPTTCARRKNVKVFVRILPSTNFSYDCIKLDPDLPAINVLCLRQLAKNFNINKKAESSFWSFVTDGIFFNVSQEEVYESVLGDIIDKLLLGINVIIICFGQTGTGKSFTVNGLSNKFLHRGLAPRLFTKLFERKCHYEDDMSLVFKMNYVEVIGSVLKDLLDETHEPSSSRDLNFDPSKNVSTHCLTSEEESLELLFKGESRRFWCKEAPYPAANMGHSILTILVENTSLLLSQSTTVQSKIHILDMAGIDNAGKASSEWKTPKEIGRSNVTNTILQQFLTRMNSSKAASSRPERLSTLIRYLSKTLNKDTTIRMIGHISGLKDNLDTTLSTLRFAGRASGLSWTKINVSRRPQPDLQLQTMEQYVTSLRDRVEVRAMLENQTDWKPNNISPIRLSQIQNTVHDFIQGHIDELKITSVAENSASMQIFKDVYAQLKRQKANVLQTIIKLAEESCVDGVCEKIVSDKAVNVTKDKSLTSYKVSSSLSTNVGRSRGKKTSSKVVLDVSKDSSALAVNVDIIKTTPPPPPPTPNQPVGVLENCGITIGPGLASDYEGKSIRATKRNILMERKLEAEKDEAPPPKTLSCVSLQDQLFPPQETPSDNELKQRRRTTHAGSSIFSTENIVDESSHSRVAHVVEMRGIVHSLRIPAEDACKNYTHTFTEMKELKTSLVNLRQELFECQHYRHCSGKEKHDQDGKIFIGQQEKIILEEIKAKEDELKVKQDMMVKTTEILNECMLRLNEARKRLEETSMELAGNENTPVAVENETVAKAVEEPVVVADSLEEKRSKYFYHLQHILFYKSIRIEKHNL